MTSKIEYCTERYDNAAWIEPYRKAFLDQLAIQGYTDDSRHQYARTINRFCSELEGSIFKQGEVNGAAIETFRLSVLKSLPECSHGWATYHIKRFIGSLVKAGVVRLPTPPAKKPTAMDRLRTEYDSYLRVQRGLSETTIYNCLTFLNRFMAFRFEGGFGDLNAITPNDIFSFFRKITNRRARPYRCKTVPSHLRNLFKFLFWSGKTKQNLTGCIPRIAQPKAANLPRYLKPDAVRRLIDAARSDSARGRRDYAILLLLARLGLRAREVVSIQLEDIDWRCGEILIRGKGKLHDRMPLHAEVGRAIVNYIQNGRVSDSRALFVSDRTPHEAFKSAQIINYVLNRAFEKAGLKQPQEYIGSHLLRHSLATALLGKGASLEEISHVLRHRSRATTMIYAKCDLGALRSIAQAWPVEGGVL